MKIEELKKLNEEVQLNALLNASKLEKMIAIQENIHECLVKECEKKPTKQVVISCIACFKHAKVLIHPFMSKELQEKLKNEKE